MLEFLASPKVCWSCTVQLIVLPQSFSVDLAIHTGVCVHYMLAFLASSGCAGAAPYIYLNYPSRFWWTWVHLARGVKLGSGGN